MRIVFREGIRLGEKQVDREKLIRVLHLMETVFREMQKYGAVRENMV